MNRDQDTATHHEHVIEHRKRVLLAINDAIAARHGRRLPSNQWKQRLGISREFLGKVARGERRCLSVKAAIRLGALLVDLDLDGKDCLFFLKASREDDFTPARVLESVAAHAERVAASGIGHLEVAIVADGEHELVRRKIPFAKEEQTIRFSVDSRVITVTTKDRRVDNFPILGPGRITEARTTSPLARDPTHDLQRRDRALDADVPRLALGEGPQAVCGHRGRQARARGHRVRLHPAGLRPQDHPPGPARPGSPPRWTRRAGS